MATQRPSGVTVLAALQGIWGILSLLLAISILFLGGIFFAADAVRDAGTPATEAGPLFTGLGLVALSNAMVGLMASYGMFALKGWGWTLAILLALLSIVQSALAIFQGNIPIGILSLVISGLILYYLNRSNVKRAFGKF